MDSVKKRKRESTTDEMDNLAKKSKTEEEISPSESEVKSKSAKKIYDSKVDASCSKHGTMDPDTDGRKKGDTELLASDSRKKKDGKSCGKKSNKQATKSTKSVVGKKEDDKVGQQTSKVKRSRFSDIRPRAPHIKRTACLNANAIVSLMYEKDEPQRVLPKRQILPSTSYNMESSETESVESEVTFPKWKSNEKTNTAKPISLKDSKIKRMQQNKIDALMKKKKSKVASKVIKKKETKTEFAFSPWSPPRRMASLNAQAILAACREERPKKPKVTSPPSQSQKSEGEEVTSKQSDNCSSAPNSSVKDTCESSINSDAVVVKSKKSDDGSASSKSKEKSVKEAPSPASGGNSDQGGAKCEGVLSCGARTTSGASVKPMVSVAGQTKEIHRTSSISRGQDARVGMLNQSPDVQILEVKPASGGGPSGHHAYFQHTESHLNTYGPPASSYPLTQAKYSARFPHSTSARTMGTQTHFQLAPSGPRNMNSHQVLSHGSFHQYGYPGPSSHYPPQPAHQGNHYQGSRESWNSFPAFRQPDPYSYPQGLHYKEPPTRLPHPGLRYAVPTPPPTAVSPFDSRLPAPHPMSPPPQPCSTPSMMTSSHNIYMGCPPPAPRPQFLGPHSTGPACPQPLSPSPVRGGPPPIPQHLSQQPQHHLMSSSNPQLPDTVHSNRMMLPRSHPHGNLAQHPSQAVSRDTQESQQNVQQTDQFRQQNYPGPPGHVNLQPQSGLHPGSKKPEDSKLLPLVNPQPPSGSMGGHSQSSNRQPPNNGNLSSTAKSSSQLHSSSSSNPKNNPNKAKKKSETILYNSGGSKFHSLPDSKDLSEGGGANPVAPPAASDQTASSSTTPSRSSTSQPSTCASNSEPTSHSSSQQALSDAAAPITPSTAVSGALPNVTLPHSVTCDCPQSPTSHLMSASSCQPFMVSGQGIPVVPFRHYGSAFALPTFDDQTVAPPMAFGYYQPAGPLIQTMTAEPCFVSHSIGIPHPQVKVLVHNTSFLTSEVCTNERDKSLKKESPLKSRPVLRPKPVPRAIAPAPVTMSTAAPSKVGSVMGGVTSVKSEVTNISSVCSAVVPKKKQKKTKDPIDRKPAPCLVTTPVSTAVVEAGVLDEVRATEAASSNSRSSVTSIPTSLPSQLVTCSVPLSAVKAPDNAPRTTVTSLSASAKKGKRSDKKHHCGTPSKKRCLDGVVLPANPVETEAAVAKTTAESAQCQQVVNTAASSMVFESVGTMDGQSKPLNLSATGSKDHGLSEVVEQGQGDASKRAIMMEPLSVVVGGDAASLVATKPTSQDIIPLPHSHNQTKAKTQNKRKKQKLLLDEDRKSMKKVKKANKRQSTDSLQTVPMSERKSPKSKLNLFPQESSDSKKPHSNASKKDKLKSSPKKIKDYLSLNDSGKTLPKDSPKKSKIITTPSSSYKKDLSPKQSSKQKESSKSKDSPKPLNKGKGHHSKSTKSPDTLSPKQSSKGRDPAKPSSKTSLSKSSSKSKESPSPKLPSKETSPRQRTKEFASQVMKAGNLSVCVRLEELDDSVSRSSLSPGKKRELKKSTPTWQWEGAPESKAVPSCLPDTLPEVQTCYPAIRHKTDGDVITERDCVLVKSGPRKRDIPFVAKICALWEKDGEMLMTVFWFYRPEHTESEKLPRHVPMEVFASKHRDVIPVACIEDKCYVLTYNEFCRQKAEATRQQDGAPPRPQVVPPPDSAPTRRSCLPPSSTDPECIFLCRRVYDVKLKRVLKNPQIPQSPSKS